jgi:aminoglycoside phosphotransferase (APT) family kinase protein
MDRLWHSPARRSGRLRLAEPLAFRPEAGLLLQAPVPGRPAAPDRNDERFLDLVHAAASSLAALHGTGVSMGREVPLENVLAAFHASVPDLSFTSPELFVTARRLLDHLEARARRGTAGELVPSHGDFKWDQFLVSRGRYTLIDFESFCQAEPALDLGSFGAYLPPSTADDWRDSAAAELERAAFLKTYEEMSGRRIDLDRLSLYEATALARRAIAHMWTQSAGWELRASSLLDLAFERLQNPEPDLAPAP